MHSVISWNASAERSVTSETSSPASRWRQGRSASSSDRILLRSSSVLDTTLSDPLLENAMAKVQVFDPPMCCSTGVCGPEVDPALVRFASDLEWLKANGVEVERFNLSQEPAAFVGNPVVAQAIRGRDDGLPLLLVDGKIVAQGRYPARKVLTELAGLAPAKSIYSEAVQELVAIG